MEGYSASQALDQLHDKVVVMSTLTDKQKSIITERMAVSGTSFIVHAVSVLKEEKLKQNNVDPLLYLCSWWAGG